MTDLMELASRVEAGEGPDRELDADIQDAVRLGGYKADRDGCSGNLCGTMTRMAADGDGVEWKPLPAFTASLDAAMSLVSEGWRIWTADFSIEGRFVWMLCGPKLTWITLEDGSREGGDDWYQSGVASSPALALTAAALHARATKEPPMSNSEMVQPTQGDRDAVQKMLDHAFRNVGVRALRDVSPADILEHFARYRVACMAAGR